MSWQHHFWWSGLPLLRSWWWSRGHWDHNDGAAALTRARSSDSQAPALVPTTAAVQLSFLLTRQAASVWSLLGPCENVTYVWRWGLVQGTRHSHILRHQTRPGGQGLRVSNRPIFTPYRSRDTAILLIQSVAGRRRGAVRRAGSWWEGAGVVLRVHMCLLTWHRCK